VPLTDGVTLPDIDGVLKPVPTLSEIFNGEMR
jgi:hypothetical protein